MTPNLVYVITVYGEKLRVNQIDLDNSSRVLIPIYNRNGIRILDQKTYNPKKDLGRSLLHKENIWKTLP
jgi:hypothetical protein